MSSILISGTFACLHSNASKVVEKFGQMIQTPYDYLMNICTACYLVCYVPDLYANYRNKNANVWNLPEKALIFVGSGFALAFSVLTHDPALIINFAPLFVLDGASLGMRTYYAYRNRKPLLPTSYADLEVTTPS